MFNGTKRKLRTPVVEVFREHCINLKVATTVYHNKTIDTGVRSVNCFHVYLGLRWSYEETKNFLFVLIHRPRI